MTSIMFVCLGNICRSPAAEAILRHMATEAGNHNELTIQSSGLGDWHIGQLPDERMRDTAKLRGVHLTTRAQQFKLSFFEDYDYILAADHEVLHELQRHAKTTTQKAKIHLITAFSSTYRDQEIPDPYYQGDAAFDLVLDMLEDSCQGLLDHIKRS